MFTQNRVDGGDWNNQNGFFLIASNGTSDIVIMRQDAWDNKANGEGFTISWDWDNDGATWLADMDGATVDMYVSLNGTTFSQNSTITSGDGKRTYTYSYSKTLDSAPASLNIRLSVHYSYLEITTADLSTTVTYDFTSYSTRTLANSGTKAAKRVSTDTYYASNFPEVYNRFAFQFRDGASNIPNIKSTGLNFPRTGGDHFAVMDLAAKDKVTIHFTGGSIMLRGSIPNYTVGDANTWNNYTSGTQLTMNSADHLFAQAKSNCTLTSVVIETVTPETVTVPTIESAADGNERTVTITAGTSNLKSGVTTYYTTNGTEPTISSTLYTAPFNVSETTTIKAITVSNSSAATHSSVATALIDMDVVDVPTAAITAVDGISRTVTFSCTTDGATTAYSIKNGENWDEYVTASSLVISANTTIKVKATKGTKEVVSDELTFEAGTAIKLNAPTYTIGAYSEGAYTLTVNTDQSNKLLTPTASIKYTVDGGSESTIASGETITAAVGTIIKIWSAVNGYTKSDDVDVAPTYINFSEYRTDWSSDFKALAGSITGTGSSNYDHSASVTKSEEELISGYYNITNEGFNSNFGVNNVNWQVRYYGATKEPNTGLWPYGVSGKMAIADLSAGDVIVFEATGAVNVNNNATKDLFTSTANSNYTFVVNTDGYATFNATTSSYIYSVTVYTKRPASVSKSITSAGWATYCSPYALDLENATGLEDAYIVTGGENGVLTKTSVKSGTVPANTGLLLKGSEGTATIPVVGSSATSVADNILEGVTTATEIEAEAGWVLMASPSLGFYQNEAAFTVGANTAYIPVAKLAVPAGARAFFSLDDETNGINAVATDVMNGKYYNLSGQRVAAPQKGLYIVNGKKVVVK